MVATHDLQKKHHGRRKLGKRKRYRRWLHRHRKRIRKFRTNARARKRNWKRRQKYLGRR